MVTRLLAAPAITTYETSDIHHVKHLTDLSLGIDQHCVHQRPSLDKSAAVYGVWVCGCSAVLLVARRHYPRRAGPGVDSILKRRWKTLVVALHFNYNHYLVAVIILYQ